MRTTHRCPKCNHPEVLYIPQLADRDDAHHVRPLVIHVVEYDWREDAEFGRIEAYACTKCGFTELYTKDVQAIPLKHVPGAKVLKAK